MILFWNVRGINDPRKPKSLRVALKKFQINIICLLETHVRYDNFLSIVGRIFPGWNINANYDHAQLGRIWIAHDEKIRLEVFPRLLKQFIATSILCN